MQRRRLIRSGHFGALRQSNSGKKEGMMTVRRTRNLGGVEYGRDSSVMLNLSYVIYRHDLIYSSNKKPLLVIHGGPGLPSDYLQPISKNFPDRCVIFYDQIGCGNSSTPSDLNFYSIEEAVNDLECFIQYLNLKQFHLYGHSFGGIIAYEYSKKQCEGHMIHTEQAQKGDIHDMKPSLLSITFCSAPSNLREVEDESKMLLDSFIPTCSTDSNTMDEASESYDEIYKNSSFQKEFVCRTSDGILPVPLQEAYKKKGNVWEGSDAIIDYIAQPLNDTASFLPPVMLLRGEYDFVSEKHGFDDWKNLINHNSVICRTMSSCAHYSMLENSASHSTTLESFLGAHENESPVTVASQ